MKTNMTDEDLRRWAIAEVMVRRGYSTREVMQDHISAAREIVEFIRKG